MSPYDSRLYPTEADVDRAFHPLPKCDAWKAVTLAHIDERGRLTQAELAERLRLDEQTVANFEKGKRAHGAIDVAVRMMYLTHVTPAEVLGKVIRDIQRALPRVEMPDVPRRKMVCGWEDRQAA